MTERIATAKPDSQSPESRSSTLALAALFAYGLILALCMAVAGILIGAALSNANYLELLPGYPLSTLLATAFPALSAVAFYLLYRIHKRGGASLSLLSWIAALALAVVFYLTVANTVFAFTRVVSILAALVFVATVAGLYIQRETLRGGLIAGAVGCAVLSVLLCAVEAILVRQLIVDLTPSHLKDNVLNFPGDVMAGEGEDIPGNLKRNLDDRISLGDGSVGRIVTNADGFRSVHPLTMPKPADEFRILYLGDSFTYGYRTDQSRSAAAVIEELLSTEMNLKVRVYPAWTEDQAGMVKWLRKHPARFEADLILHGVCLGNDLGTNMRQLVPPSTSWSYGDVVPAEYLDLAVFRPDGAFVSGTQAREFRDQLRFTQTLRILFAPTPISTGFEIKAGAAPLWNQQNNIGIFLKDEGPAREMFQVFERNLSRARDLAGPTPVYSVLFPQRYQQSEREWQTMIHYYGLRADAFDLDLPNRKIREICERNALNCFDLLPAFRERGKELLHYPYDMHWNDAGNRLAGEAMAEYLAPIVRAMIGGGDLQNEASQ